MGNFRGVEMRSQELRKVIERLGYWLSLTDIEVIQDHDTTWSGKQMNDSGTKVPSM